MAGRYFATRPTLSDGQGINEEAVDSKGRLIVVGASDGTSANVALTTLMAGEDLANDVLGAQPKPVVTATYSGTPFQAVLNDVDIAVKAAAGQLLAIRATNINAAIRYLQIHNKTTAPAGGDTALISIPIPAGSATVPSVIQLGNDFFGNNGIYLNTGISIGISTAAATFTAATTTDHVVTGLYV